MACSNASRRRWRCADHAETNVRQESGGHEAGEFPLPCGWGLLQLAVFALREGKKTTRLRASVIATVSCGCRFKRTPPTWRQPTTGVSRRISAAHWSLSRLEAWKARSSASRTRGMRIGTAQVPSISTDTERWSNSMQTTRRVVLAWRITIPRTPCSGPAISSTVSPILV